MAIETADIAVIATDGVVSARTGARTAQNEIARPAAKVRATHTGTDSAETVVTATSGAPRVAANAAAIGSVDNATAIARHETRARVHAMLRVRAVANASSEPIRVAVSRGHRVQRISRRALRRMPRALAHRVRRAPPAAT